MQQYGPLMQAFGISENHVKVFMALPDILDAVAGKLQAIEAQITDLRGTAPARAQTTSIAPAYSPLNPGGAKPPGVDWGKLLQSPEVLKIVQAFLGSGEQSVQGVNSGTLKLAKAIEEGALKTAYKSIAQAFDLTDKAKFYEKMDAAK